jgi:dihydroorotase
MNLSDKNYKVLNPQILKSNGELETKEFIYISEGKWTSEEPKGFVELEGKDLILLPLLTELSADFKEPGREYVYSLQEGAEAMRRGGFSKVLLSPNSKPVIDESTHVEGLKQKTLGLGVDMLISAALSKDLNDKLLPEIVEMIAEGATAISNGLRPLPETKFLLSAMKYASQVEARIHLFPLEKDLDLPHYFPEGPLASSYGLKAIPKIAEEISVYRILQLAKHTKCSIHIMHITSMESVRLIEVFKKQGVDVTCDVSIHNLQWNEEDLVNLDPALHVIPPLVNKKVQDELLDAIDKGIVDFVSSQHLPVLPEFKNTIFEASQPGISCLEITMSTVLSKSDVGGLTQFVKKNVENSSKILNSNMEWPAEGSSVGFSLFNTNSTYVVDSDTFAGRVHNSPFMGKELKGQVIAFVNQSKVWMN